MSTTTTETATGSSTRSLARNPGRLSRAVGDTIAVAGRNLVTLVRLPQLLVFATIQPVIFVLLFRYAFGGAINTPGLAYVDYLMPGIFAQTVAFGSMGTGIGLAEDLNKGLIERFRSLPMARSAMLAGRILSDLVRNVFVVVLMCVVGFAVGFRVHTNAAQFLAGLVVLLLFGCALSAISLWRGCPSRTARRPRRRPSRCWRRWCSPPRPSSPSAPCPAGSRPSPSTSPCRWWWTPSGPSLRVTPPYASCPKARPRGATWCSRCSGRRGSWPCSAPWPCAATGELPSYSEQPVGD